MHMLYIHACVRASTPIHMYTCHIHTIHMHIHTHTPMHMYTMHTCTQDSPHTPHTLYTYTQIYIQMHAHHTCMYSVPTSTLHTYAHACAHISRIHTLHAPHMHIPHIGASTAHKAQHSCQPHITCTPSNPCQALGLSGLEGPLPSHWGSLGQRPGSHSRGQPALSMPSSGSPGWHGCPLGSGRHRHPKLTHLGPRFMYFAERPREANPDFLPSAENSLPSIFFLSS